MVILKYMKNNILNTIIDDFAIDKFIQFFRAKNRSFRQRREELKHYDDDRFTNGIKLGEIDFKAEGQNLIICAFESSKSLTERSGKKAQYEKAKIILKKQRADAGIFIYYDLNGNFRFSLIYANYFGTKRNWSAFRRFTYFVSSDAQITNKTFLKQIGICDFTSLGKIKEAFSITAVTDLFYDEFFQIYNKVVEKTKQVNKMDDEECAGDFVLLFIIRTVFIGFIQKRKWIGDDEKFVQSFFREYKDKSFGKNEFYSRWIKPLFFEALNSQPGKKVAYGNNDFSPETENKLQMAPYLNGGLFKEKPAYDDKGWIIPDVEIEQFFSFLFAHSFTIEENSLDDEDLQLNPEFLGIIFERLVNKANGAVYTPRTEVDLICRLSLVKWLQKNLENPVKADNLYELFFKEIGKEEDQKEGSFSKKEAQAILDELQKLAICDPAVGSGAFLVGMMQVLDHVEQSLRQRYGLDDRNIYERKKQIIKDSLYGVEVKEWAVWICQLRLWLSLFVDAPDALRNSLEPILPSLDFKIRQGDSLIQRVGSKAFPVSGHNMELSQSIKVKITKLKNLKLQYFDNKSELKEWELKRNELDIYKEILNIEIKEKNEQLRKLKNINPVKNLELFVELIEPEQKELEFNKEKNKKLEDEIAELKAQETVLHSSGKPLVWSIEFAEVFAEKDGFDLIIGNPPYVRQEYIEDPIGKIKDKKEYKTHLQEMVRIDFPDDFSPKVKMNAKSDLYTYFYIRGLRLLNRNGIHTYICSNSWLDVGYGVWLQDFLLKRCRVDLIIDNHAKRSFGAADVNTIISIIHAPQKKSDEKFMVKFVALKKPFEEAIFTENLLQIEYAKQVESNDIFRVYPIIAKKLRESGTEYDSETKMQTGKYIGDKWGGKYLRAPDIFFTILEKGKNKLVKLGDVADVRRGITTGVNKFFYLTKEQIQHWQIESEFLKPVIKSPRECKSIIVNPKDLKYKIFICNKSKEELKGTNALKYIEWGETQKKNNVYWSAVPSVQGRKYWYELGPVCGNTFWGKEIRKRLAVFISNEDYFADCRMYYSYLDRSNQFVCNSTIYAFMSEVMKRDLGGGGGPRSLMVYEVSDSYVLMPNLLSLPKNKILSRDIKTIFEECGIYPNSDIPIEKQEPNPLPDRAELDTIVFDALELTEDERKEVYRAVCRLVWNRISKAKSV